MLLGRTALVSVTAATLSYCLHKLIKNYPNPSDGIIFYYFKGSTELRHIAEDRDPSSISLEKDEPLLFLIHGYTESSFRPWVYDVADALLVARPNATIILPDHWNYVTISRPWMDGNVLTIASEIARFIDDLSMKRNFSLSKVHLIGFSLGGRICGGIKHFIKTNQTIGRITGIDASYPWKPSSNKEDFLDHEDADLVVNIRTSYIGSETPLVDIDFLINGDYPGGIVQPGCSRWYLPFFAQELCSHYRALKIFADAVRLGSEFKAGCRCASYEELLKGKCGCDEVNYVGLDTRAEPLGKFYLHVDKIYT